MKKIVNLFKGLTGVSISLTTIALFGTSLTNKWQGNINAALNVVPPTVAGDKNSMYYKTEFSEDGTLSDESLNKMLQASDANMVETIEESSILLKNDDNTLPLKESERKVTLFSHASYENNYKGSMAGGPKDDPKHTVSLYDALKAQNFSINDTLYNAYKNSKTSREDGGLGEENKAFYTDSIKSSFSSYNDVALVNLVRYAGEGKDLKTNYNGKSILALQDEEKDLFSIIKAGGFKKVVVLINSCYPMELSYLEQTEYGINAALWIGGPGKVGFNGVVNVLTGKADATGHTIDTFATDSLSSPACQNYGDYAYTNADTLKQINPDTTKFLVEAEGIYVGYRYYETRYEDQVLNLHNATSTKGSFASGNGQNWDYAKEVTYPFGYGKSYCNFTQELQEATWDRTNHLVNVKVKVTNNGVDSGSTYSGKSKATVQLYVQAPWKKGQAEKSSIQLIEFGKSKALAKGESDIVEISADDYLFATFDENATNGADTTKKGCYVFDEGDYYFAIGDNCHDALNNVLAAKGVSSLVNEKGESVSGDGLKVKKETLDKLDNTTYAKSRETGNVVYSTLKHVDLNSYQENSVTYLTRDDWNTFPSPYVTLTANQAMINDLSLNEYTKKADAKKYDSSTLSIAKGIKYIDMKDAPYSGKYTDANGVEQDADKKWDEFLRQLSLNELVSSVSDHFGHDAIEVISKPANAGSDGPAGPQGSYLYGEKNSKGEGNPSSQHEAEVNTASTWNKDLLANRGKFIGEDCLYTGTTQLWGPGADIHRTPFSGRNPEYYSEDSVMSYLCSIPQVKAMQEKGVNTCIKHLCGNDQELNRSGVSQFMTEQAFRQGPLKGFEGALTKGGALGFMMSMGRYGVTMSYVDKAVITGVIRDEWGFKGVNTTDYSEMGAKPYKPVTAFMAGTDTFNGDSQGVNKSAVKTQIIKTKDGDILDRLLEENKRFYYSMLRSNNINGLGANSKVEKFVPWWQKVITALDITLGVISVASLAGFILFRYVFKEKPKAEQVKEEN